jgi:flagellar L-ring protein FlgH
LKYSNSIFLSVCALFLASCVTDLDKLSGQKNLSPSGSGFIDDSTTATVATYPTAHEQNASWVGGPADLFRDRRVHKIGDILTVQIFIDDKASISNNSNVSKKSTTSGDLGAKFSTLGVVSPDMKGSASVNSALSSAGQGTTVRSEKIELAVAAVVTAVLENGFLVVKGTQEIQVNSETRLLKISGIVRPNDITENRFVNYDKIAEARISYGGTGAISEVQAPGWGQRLFNRLNPF